MSPGVAPRHKVVHRDHGDTEAFVERLPTDDRKGHVDCRGGNKTVLEATQLVPRHPVFAFLQVVLGDRRNGGVLDQERDEFTLLLPCWANFTHRLLVEGLVRF